MSEHEEDGYSGEATLVIDGVTVAVTVDLRGYFQPIDGYYRWYGRVAVHEELARLAGGKKKPVSIRAGEHTATGELSDPDPWGRYRIMGTSTPPFHVPTTLEELNA
ncbi:DUF4873 domain-containing protein [Amycolatopsis sp. A133]|jgi:hypothetical protein|uniref:DUF4873 domain-containing protein n=1 Tax=Amycolatopsis sp. A133 TaxID=3064472 RepID=UPI0027E68D17|nr:DUF4873 domain-containing protein [Amycolatopsis sp. A133]MDQ7809266.1 DUF4873 domain-containing protein [Amycolatopsis sp. A133]